MEYPYNGTPEFTGAVFCRLFEDAPGVTVRDVRSTMRRLASRSVRNCRNVEYVPCVENVSVKES